MTRWSAQTVANAAPDQASLTAARRLARPGPWSDTGSTEVLVWGKCQGSGRTPYQVSIDLNGPAYRCSCPSRKFPCKHALALLLLWVEGSGSVKDAETAAGYAAEWAEQRASQAAGTAQKEAAEKKPVDLEARAKRLEDRLLLMDGGVVEFRLWMADLVRGGLAAARRQPYAWWDTAAARLVDSQLPGLAEQVRDMAAQVNGRDDWADHLLAGLGRWWSTTAAWQRRDTLPDVTRADLRTGVGWPVPTEEVRSQDSLTDQWLVLGAHRTDDGRLLQQRTWLWGMTSHETLQVLDFAARAQPLPVARVVGAVLEATVARYPGTTPRRALFATEPVAVDRLGGLPAAPVLAGSVSDALARAADTRAANPWSWRIPAVIRDARVVPAGASGSSYVVDTEGHALPLTADADPWALLAHGEGQPLPVFGELESGRFRPLSATVGAEVIGT